MPTTESFVINKKSKKLLKKNGNSFDYWRGEKKGTIIGEIEVFAFNNHQEEAEKVLTLLKENNIEDKYFKIRVDLKS